MLYDVVNANSTLTRPAFSSNYVIVKYAERCENRVILKTQRARTNSYYEVQFLELSLLTFDKAD